ncbi:uncharacterized protein LOC111374826 [Olea europaea var. sylvestris]|uniref:uncharacterized protein LOC111374826 n=1 Tax=Olea europaea var. sylvestris TaxID=158386 RepID=UPI000C1CEA29|nr:uncharacterized protein LOC111374826 [Olea europaea var. sylvestris]
MYPVMLRTFTHILRDEYGLRSAQQVDVYEQVGIIRLIRPNPNYNNGKWHHVLNLTQHPLFENCIGVIDGMHVKAILPRDERVNFIGSKGISTQNVLVACDFNLCFTFVHAGWMGTTHDSLMLARAIHSPKIDFPKSAPGKYYLVDSGFVHRPGYMVPYKGLDILYHFQQFYDGQTGARRNFCNAHERFNFRHSSCRNVIECAFGVWKSGWKILDRMPSYNFKVLTAVVLATMGIHNFLRRAGVVEKAFTRAETDPDAAEVELPDEQEQAAAEFNAPEMQRNERDRFRDYLAQRH